MLRAYPADCDVHSGLSCHSGLANDALYGGINDDDLPSDMMSAIVQNNDRKDSHSIVTRVRSGFSHDFVAWLFKASANDGMASFDALNSVCGAHY
jgi:hypothetical protein